jgi:hypothetical protein
MPVTQTPEGDSSSSFSYHLEAFNSLSMAIARYQGGISLVGLTLLARVVRSIAIGWVTRL